MREDLLPKTREGKLNHLSQECAEVVVAVTKLQIFGPLATDPKTGIKYDNVVNLMAEIKDLNHAITAILEEYFPTQEETPCPSKPK